MRAGLCCVYVVGMDSLQLHRECVPQQIQGGGPAAEKWGQTLSKLD